MNKTLHITNGDVAVDIMKEAGVEGDFLPWRDILHEGVVPAGLSLEVLSKTRIAYISQDYGTFEDVKHSFESRDSMMRSLERYEKILLWFEHDLYDQLQLLQILDFLHTHPVSCTLSIICTDNYLGMCAPSEMLELQKYETAISKEHLSLGAECWKAFTSPNPLVWQDFLKKDTSLLPFLECAVLRLLEEYPSEKNGLSRTANIALEVIAKGESKPGRVFGEYIKTEERRFLGDSSFWNILKEMLEAKTPLLKINMPLLPINPKQSIEITQMGREVLDGTKHWLMLEEIDKWIGGVHLTHDNLWVWDGQTLKRLEG
ncbi:MAG: Unknown protein [uncultured Sulfurovum sp.]|uniref:DUF1835 domain-containing protein n=1 Tax=uncultured Sulfurovum sp. TaxID=269237 RepID=A0A6S6SE99_9BACT|nr:MAG: Unknown protein [uncultured Sulfurovum sp.]